MANTGTSSWEKIRLGVKETERLIGQKQYNGAMVKARQTLEFMVKQLCERAGIAADADLKDSIDALYENRWIDKATYEHYHKIRTIGNKAVHEDNNNAYDANQAYHMLSQEVYTFANDYRNAQRGSRPRGSGVRTGVSTRTTTSSRTAAPARTATSSRTATSARTAASSRTDTNDRAVTSSRAGTTGSTSASSRAGSSARAVSSTGRSATSRTRSRRQLRRRRRFTVYDLLKLLIPVLCIILLFCVIRLIRPDSSKSETTTAAPVETTRTVEPPTTTAAPETEPTEEETAPDITWRTTTTINVRSQPSTEASKLGQLGPDTVVEYVDAYDAEWAVILYNGQEAYVASAYLTAE